MSIEGGRYELDSADVIEPTQKLVAVAREKYIQRRQRDENQLVSQSIISSTHDLSIVVPTRNERENIGPLLESLQTALCGLRVEVIFVDDSDDETPDVIEDAARTMSSSLFQIHLEHRLAGEARAGGLATAVVAGLKRAQADYVAVLDADLQHPPEQLRALYDQAVAQHGDLVVASRYLKGGSYQGLAGVRRRCISVGLKWTAKLLFPEHLLRLSDPLGGFFLLRRSLLTDVSLRPVGYKILLELLLRCPWRQVVEVPYQFQARAHGQSKATLQQGIQVLRHMLRLWREVPTAGWVWKIGVLFLLNVLIALALFIVNQSFSSVWANLNSVVFSVMACLDLVLFNRFIFPSPMVTSSVAASVPSMISVEEERETVELPSPGDAISNGHHPHSTEEDGEGVEPPAAGDVITNGSHPPSTEEDGEGIELPAAGDVIFNAHHLPSTEEERETVELPSPGDAIFNAHHLPSVEEERETVELSSAKDAITNGHHPHSTEEERETVELPSPGDAISNGHHPPSIEEERETVELPSPGDAITNGYHPPTSEEGDGVEPASPEPVVASAIDLQRKSPPTWKKKFSDKFPSLMAVAAVILAIGWISYKLPGALLVLAVLFIGAAILVAREKNIQRGQQDANQAVSQSILSTTHDLSIVVPTRNERENIWPLVESLQTALCDLRVEVIFVDDSDDDTPDFIEDAAKAMSSSLFQIQLEHRLAGEARAGGLATAVVQGLNRAQADYVAVLDADLQHPPEQLRVLFDQAVAQHGDLVVASRYIKGGSYQGMAGAGRRCISLGLKWTAKLLFPEHLLRLSDPLGGFFLLRRSLLTDVSLRPVGYKILLELLLRCPWRQVVEVPYQFQARAHGQSKATLQQGIQVLRHMLRLWREVPAAGRVWKISLLLLLNVLSILALLNVNQSFPLAWVNLNSVVFSVMACLDLVLFNRFIFPAPMVTSSVAASVSSLISVEEERETVEPPSPGDAIPNGHHPHSTEEDGEGIEPPAAGDVIPNGSHLPSTEEERETVELPSPGDAITNGSHPPTSEERETVELPSPGDAIPNGHQPPFIEDIETIELPVAGDAITNGHRLPSVEIELPAAGDAITNGHRLPSVEEEIETVELSSARDAITNGHHLHSTEEERETVELPSSGDAITDGHRLPSVEERETVEPPAPEPVVASAIELQRESPPAWKKKITDRFPSLLPVAMVILAAGWISYKLPGALLVLAVLFIGAAIVFTKNVNREQAITMVLAITVGVASIDYVSWRFVVTNWPGWWLSVPLLFAETLGALHTLGFQFTVWPWSPPEIEQSEDPTRHPIFIFIPTVNEGVAILRPTLEGIIAARDKYLAKYPHGRVTIVVCNDGRVAKAANWEETDILAKELGVCCVTRTKRGGAKAGNIENARQELQATGDALLAIFDADQVAKPDFLLKTIPPFCDPKMGWVQTGQYYANLDNPVSRWADDQQSMFYNLLCPGKAALNAAFICGTNVVIRAAALDEIGGLPQDSVTEDFAASIALHPSWRSFYLTDVLATGLGPLDVPSYLKQQGRWAMGTLGVFRTHWREIFLPKKHGLRIGQRVQYFLACTHYLCGLRDLIYMVSPILFIFTGIPAVRSAYLSDYLWHFIPYGLLSATAMWYSSRGITGLRGIIIGFGSFPALIGSLLSVVLQRKVGFAVTSKRRGGRRSLSYLWVYCFFLLLCVASLFWVTQVKGQQQTALFISVLWVVYSMLMLGSFLWLTFKDIRFQAALQQSGAADEIIAKQPYPLKLLQRKRGLNPVWNLGLAALVACPILASGSVGSLTFFLSSKSTPFVISQEKIAAPYFGVSLPVQLLTNRPPVLEHDLGTQFSIIGRTQDIHDQFDTTWADQLAAQHARPWITLQFGVFGPNNKPPLDANLLAVMNGLHDQKIRRWAEDIRNYGKPVYLTVFQHADRNWSLSSGVANGGIPQDVPKAWMHVQSVFHAVGANNVAWVWAPADPIHDQAYAPPASTIDAVLQSFINYPGTKWGDPETVLHNLVQRYPTKPIFVEASADGPAEQKAAWLTKLGQAVNDVPQVYALLYHEGGPGLVLTSAEIESWSLASDPDSLAAMRGIVVGLHKKAIAHS